MARSKSSLPRTLSGGTRPYGQALVEFALVFPLIALLIFGVIDLGRLAFSYTTITNAARTGARVALVDQTAGAAATAAANQAVSLGIAPGSVAVSYRTPNLATACSPVAIGCIAEVTVPYGWQPLTPILSWISPVFNLTATARMPVERRYP